MTATNTLDVLARVIDDDNLADPYPFLAWVREHSPVHRQPSGVYLVTRHADALQVLDFRLFCAPGPEHIATLFPMVNRFRSMRLMYDTITMKNPPEHTRLRRLLSRDFTPRRLENLRQDVAGMAEQAIDAIEAPLRDGETVDLHATISNVLPAQVMCQLLGLPAADRQWLFSRFGAVLGTFVPNVSEEALIAADHASTEIADYMTELTESRRATPADGLISAWVQAHDNDPDQFTHDELISMLWGLIAGGVVTTAASLSRGIHVLLSEPELAEWVRAGQQEVRQFNEEVLRYDSPSLVGGIPKVAVDDIELSGTFIAKGSEVRTMPGAANRDPAVFADPDRFDPTRNLGQSLSFGHGIHYCLGAAVARPQLDSVLPILHRRFPTLTLADEPRWRQKLPLHSLEYLPVRLA